MNTDIAEGKFDQLKGKAKQSVGEAIGNDRLANSGTIDQVKGAAKEAWGNAKDAAHSISSDAKGHVKADQAEAKLHASNAAHDVRERITSTAQNVKDSVSAKAEQIQHKH